MSINKQIKISFLTLFLSISLVTGVSAQQNATRVVIIGLDGFSVPGFKTARHPNIDTLFSKGVLSLTTRPVMPSVTMPNWTSHLSGAGPEEHGVASNEWTLEDHPLKAIDTDQDGYFPSVFKVLKEQVSNIKTAFFYNWANLIKPFNQRYLDEVSLESGDRFDRNYQKAVDFIETNKKDPELVFLYSVHTDHAGHNHNWMSPEYMAAIEQADTAIGNFINKLKALNLYEGTCFLLITDHGGDPKTGHGGISMDEMQVPWAITGPGIKNRGLSDFYNSNKNTSLVLARIFGVKKLPDSWTGVLPTDVFKKFP